jgi:hypothetical protein
MTDSTLHTKEAKMRTLNRDAILACVIDEDIQDAFKALLSIMKTAEKDSDKINAIKTLLEYAIAKPKQEVDVSTLGDKISAIQVQIIKPDEPTSN